jgi:ribosomal protein S18 acetylase RimI-like enzyme
MSPTAPGDSSAISPVIRLADEHDLEQLVAIEISAGHQFHAVGLPGVAEDAPDPEQLRAAIRQGRVWVADLGDVTGAYIVVEVLDGNAHIAQVSVAAQHARQGVGRALMQHVEAWGRDQGCPATTLTTFREVPWNGPYYRRLGYDVSSPSEAGPELRRTLEAEQQVPILSAAPRCAMIKHNQRESVSRTPVVFRSATRDDARAVARLVAELAAHQQQSEHVTADADSWRAMLDRPEITILLAEVDHVPIGYVSAVERPHLWTGKQVLALDDLYVRAGHRDRAIGRQLMQELARHAAGRVIIWGVQPDNHAAIRFYRGLGATVSNKVTCSWSPTSYGAAASVLR